MRRPRCATTITLEGRSSNERVYASLIEQLILCRHAESVFSRTIETADIALAGRDVPRLVIPELNDPPNGIFELRPGEEFRTWRRVHGPDEQTRGRD